MYNRAILIGRLTADPELKTTPAGASVIGFKIAVDRTYKGKDGAKMADFINIVAWRGTAEFIHKYFFKGNKILIEGEIQTRDYTDKNGEKRYITEVVASSANFVESKKEKTLDVVCDSGAAQTTPPEYVEVGDDDLPF